MPPVAYPHIVKEPNASACLVNHPRTRVSMILADYLWRGWSAEEIVRQYPYLTLAETHAALGYYFDNREEIEDELVREYEASEAWKKQHPTSPLLVRLKMEKERSAR
jgi:uncharacterized protein (DUF433 family)